MADTTDGPSLLSRAGFTLTTVDIEEITINFPSMWELLHDLRDMGETSAILGRRATVSRDVLIAAEAIYKELYGQDDSIPATFQIISMVSRSFEAGIRCKGAHGRLGGDLDPTSQSQCQGDRGLQTSKTFCNAHVAISHTW